MTSKKEHIYFWICLVLSILIYLSMIITIAPIIYLIIFGLYIFISHGLMIGHIKGNAVKVSNSQFPEVYKAAENLSYKIGLESIPDIYVLQSGGMINAFATRFAQRNFAVIYSDVLEIAYNQGESALNFIIGHEFAHLKRKHIQKRLWLLPACFIPFLGTAYSRACEYTCDRISAYFNPDGAINGLLLLAAGKNLYSKVNVQEYIAQAKLENGFWSWFAEILATHPHLYKRLQEIGQLSIFHS